MIIKAHDEAVQTGRRKKVIKGRTWHGLASTSTKWITNGRKKRVIVLISAHRCRKKSFFLSLSAMAVSRSFKSSFFLPFPGRCVQPRQQQLHPSGMCVCLCWYFGRLFRDGLCVHTQSRSSSAESFIPQCSAASLFYAVPSSSSFAPFSAVTLRQRGRKSWNYVSGPLVCMFGSPFLRSSRIFSLLCVSGISSFFFIFYFRGANHACRSFVFSSPAFAHWAGVEM